MNILFIHGNYPAQFRVLATELGRQDIHDVRFLSARKQEEGAIGSTHWENIQYT